MIEFDGGVLLLADTSLTQLMASHVAGTENAAMNAGAILSIGTRDSAVLQESPPELGDEWIVPLLSGTSLDAIAAGMPGPGEVDLVDPQSHGEEGDIVITAIVDTPRYRTTEGGGGGSGSGSGGGGSGGTGVAQHTQDCGTEDGAATQVAKHVTGELPPGVSGPENTVTTSTGNDWTKVEFGAVIVKNPDGTFGPLNNMIYSSNQPGYVGLPDSTGQPVQGIWHSHTTRDTPEQQAIDRYPSPRDWDALARVKSQAGAVADPSIWITGPDGVTREFKLSERSSIESLGVERMKNDEGLSGKERTQSCG